MFPIILGTLFRLRIVYRQINNTLFMIQLVVISCEHIMRIKWHWYAITRSETIFERAIGKIPYYSICCTVWRGQSFNSSTSLETFQYKFSTKSRITINNMGSQLILTLKLQFCLTKTCFEVNILFMVVINPTPMDTQKPIIIHKNMMYNTTYYVLYKNKQDHG